MFEGIRKEFTYLLVICLVKTIFGENEDNGTHKYSIYSSIVESSLNNTHNNTYAGERGKSFVITPGLLVIEGILNNLTNRECVRDTKIVLDSIQQREKWALQLYESTPKFPTGLLFGNYYLLGNFDECINTKHDVGGNKIQGQYCLADVQVETNKSYEDLSINNVRRSQMNARFDITNITLHWSICVPASCSVRDTEVFLRSLFNIIGAFEEVSINVDEKKCHSTMSVPFTVLEYIYGIIVGVVLLFTALSTGYDYISSPMGAKYKFDDLVAIKPQNTSILKQLCLCFSLTRNMEKWKNMKRTDLNLDCFAGIKTISMFFILCGHSLVFAEGGPLINRNYWEKSSVYLWNGVFLNNPLLVDTFLLVSGFLTCFLLLVEFEKRKGGVNFLVLFCARFIRLTPAYLVVIGFYCSFLPRIGSGPLWDSKVSLEQERCMKSWWTNVLYINNYVSSNDLCMFQAWYLAVDFHMYIIGCFLIYVIWRWKRMGEALLVACIFITIAIPIWVTHRGRLDATLMFYDPEVEDLANNSYFTNVYIKSHMRGSSYCFGIVFGYISYNLRTSGSKINVYVLWLLWIVAAVFGVTSMFSIVIFYQPDYVYNVTEAAIYASFHRIGWSIAIGCVITMCITDNANMVNKILSCKIFLPLSRLTFCAYLVNGIILIYSLGSLREPLYLSVYHLWNRMLAHVILTFGLAFVVTILFESPIHGMERIFLRKDRKSTLAPSSSPTDKQGRT